MAPSADSSEDEDVARLPTQQRTNKIPFRRTKGNKKSNPNNDGGRNDGTSGGDRGESGSIGGGKKAIEKADDPKDTMVMRVGRKAAKGFLHHHTVFPTDDCFTVKSEENSFSSLLKNTFHDDSIYKEDKDFLVLLSSNRSAWYTCCNEIRGNLIFKSKLIYFREFN